MAEKVIGRNVPDGTEVLKAKLAEAYASIERREGLLDEFWPANTPSWRK